MWGGSSRRQKCTYKNQARLLSDTQTNKHINNWGRTGTILMPVVRHFFVSVGITYTNKNSAISMLPFALDAKAPRAFERNLVLYALSFETCRLAFNEGFPSPERRSPELGKPRTQNTAKTHLVRDPVLSRSPPRFFLFLKR